MPHYNDKGQLCECGWRPSDSVEKTGATIEELRGQKKLQSPEAQALLDFLDRNGFARAPGQQKWLPWLLQNVRKGNIHVDMDPNFQHHPVIGLTYRLPIEAELGNGHINQRITPGHWQHMTDWMNSTHPTRQGKDLMSMSPAEVNPLMGEWTKWLNEQETQRGREDGQLIHQYDDGWTLRDLTDPEELKREGQAMGHCVGDYGHDVENGDMHVHSLRDEKGDPHVTYGIRWDTNHPGGYAYQVYGKGNSAVKPEYQEKLREYWGEKPRRETPLSEDEDGEIYDIHDLRHWYDRHSNGEEGRDAHGFLDSNPSVYDWHELLEKVIPEQRGAGYVITADGDDVDALYQLAKKTNQIPDLEEARQSLSERSGDEADQWFYDYGGLEHLESDQGVPLNSAYRDAQMNAHQDDWWGDPEGWQEELEKHGLPFNRQGYDLYGEQWEKAEQEARDWQWDQHPGIDLTNRLYDKMRPKPPAQTQNPNQTQLAKTAYRHHFNHRGVICRCPWGYSSPEHLGHVKTADKFEWLENRPDMQTDEGKAFLDYIRNNRYNGVTYTEADKLLPWIAREWKKKRLVPQRNYPFNLIYNVNGEPYSGFNPLNDETRPAPNYHTTIHFNPRDAVRHVKALDDMKKHRKGIDVMQHKAHELVPKVKEFTDWQKENDRSGRGTILHKFDDGWTVRRVDNREEALIEGEDMGHCIGTHHGNQVEDGDGLFVSLRDHRGHPHATMELHGHNHDEDGRPYPGENMYVEQFYGKQDEPPIDEYRDRMNEWLEPYGVKANSFEPWWDDQYYVDAPETYQDLHSMNTYGIYDHAPDDYHSATADADEHGHEPPGLDLEGEPNWRSILDDSITRREYAPGRGISTTTVPYNPEVGQDIYDIATQAGGELRWHLDDQTENLYDALDDMQKEAREDYRAEGPFRDEADAQRWWGEHPYGRMLDHLMPKFEDVYGEEWHPPYREDYPGPHPDQTMLFYPTNQNVGPDFDYDQNPILHQTYSSTNQLAPLYYRWAFDPSNGVQLSSNADDHDFRLPYHRELGGGKAQMNGYAYRIRGGWRITDWEHFPVDDPFIVSSVVKTLNKQDGQEERLSSWEAPAYDWDRLHYGLPQVRLEWNND